MNNLAKQWEKIISDRESFSNSKELKDIFKQYDEKSYFNNFEYKHIYFNDFKRKSIGLSFSQFEYKNKNILIRHNGWYRKFFKIYLDLEKDVIYYRQYIPPFIIKKIRTDAYDSIFKKFSELLRTYEDPIEKARNVKFIKSIDNPIFKIKILVYKNKEDKTIYKCISEKGEFIVLEFDKYELISEWYTDRIWDRKNRFDKTEEIIKYVKKIHLNIPISNNQKEIIIETNSKLDKELYKLKTFVEEVNKKDLLRNNSQLENYYIKDINELVLNYDDLNDDTKNTLKENIDLLTKKLEDILNNSKKKEISSLDISANIMNKILKEDNFI
jgi:hypothetical protein